MFVCMRIELDGVGGVRGVFTTMRERGSGIGINMCGRNTGG